MRSAVYISLYSSGGIREAVDRMALPGTSDAVEILHAELGERAEVLGALALVIGNTERLRSVGLAAFTPPTTAMQAGRGRPVGRKEEVHAGSM